MGLGQHSEQRAVNGPAVASADSARRAAEGRLLASLESLTDPHVVLSPVRDDDGRIVDFRYTDANSAACDYNRLTRDQLVGVRLLELLPTQRDTGLFDRYCEVIETGVPLVMDNLTYEHELLGGTPVQYDVRAFRVGDDLLFSWRDVDERHQTMEELARSRAEQVATRMSIDNAMIGMALADPRGVFVYANPALNRLLGYEAGELVGQNFRDITHPDDLPASLSGYNGLRTGALETFRTRKRYLSRTGDPIWVDIWVSPTRAFDGSVDHMFVQVVDASAEMQAIEALQRSVRRFRLLAENASDVVYQTDIEGRIEWISPSVSEVLGWDPDLLVGTRATSLVAPEDLAMMSGGRSGQIRGVREHGVLAQFLTVRGARRWMSVTAKPLVGEDDQVSGAVVSLRDVTSEQRAQEELALTQERFRLAMAAAPQGMALTDEDGVVLDVNPAAARLLGLAQRDITGRPLAEILSEEAGECGPGQRHEHVRLTESGQTWIDHVASSVPTEHDGPRYTVHQFIDETSDRMWLQELEHQASHDVLTGVPNRASLLEHLDRLLEGRRSSGRVPQRIGLLFCDLDNLKDINDTRGHQVGDAVLAQVADRLARTLRRGDRVGRIGGDEFVVVVDDVQSEVELQQVAEKLRGVVADPLTGTSAHVTVSIGTALVGPDETAREALERADSALYRAKAAGRNRVEAAT